MHFRCPKLTPLQSRFAASLAASAILVLIYVLLSNPHFAYAAELELDGSGQSRAADHNWHRIRESLDVNLDEIAGVDHGNEEVIEEEAIYRRAEAAATSLANNIPGGANGQNIIANDTQLWFFPNATLWGDYGYNISGLFAEIDTERLNVEEHSELRKREAGLLQTRQTEESRTVFISINTCLQPLWNGTGTQSADPPQLTLYVGDTSNTEPGPNSTQRQYAVTLVEGFANISITAKNDTYIAVHAPALTRGFTGVWNYQVAASIDNYYFQANQNQTDPFLYVVDTDTTAGLLYSGNLTLAAAGSEAYDAAMNAGSPYTLFATNANNTRIRGITSSYCGLQNANLIESNQADPEGIATNVQTGMINRGLGHQPQEQFYVSELNGSSTYYGFLSRTGNGTYSGPGVVGGGGKVWQSVNWTTKADGNCKLLYNLDFCDEVAYAVPYNPTIQEYSSVAALGQLYDNYTSFYYQNFNYSLQQIPCNTTSTAQYSLSQNCTTCAAAYKEWICAVTIPRCEDYSSTLPWLQQRNLGQAFYNDPGNFLPDLGNTSYIPMAGAPSLPGSPAFQQTLISSMATNSSRNPVVIDQTIKPGPYKEVLPCADLCYSIVQACPAALGFACPWPGRGLEVDYGKRSTSGSGTITCSYLGAVYYANDSARMRPRLWALVSASVIAAVVGWVL